MAAASRCARVAHDEQRQNHAAVSAGSDLMCFVCLRSLFQQLLHLDLRALLEADQPVPCDTAADFVNQLFTIRHGHGAECA